jgi:hypothetical protein
MTLAPKLTEAARTIQPQTTVASSSEVVNLWGGKKAEDDSDPWTKTAGGGLPDLPGKYGPAPDPRTFLIQHHDYI